MKLLDIVHPAAKSLVDISLSQDAEVGDGTTSVVVLAGELLKQAKPFVEDGLHTQNIIKGEYFVWSKCDPADQNSFQNGLWDV